MYDIKFFEKMYPIKQKIVSNEINNMEELIKTFEMSVTARPKVFNIETTNHCNMKCKMCPRTSLMTRNLMSMEDKVFEKVAREIEPYSEEELAHWTSFVGDYINILADEQNENHFYFYIVSKSVILHGYGEPLLDPKIAERVRTLSARGIPTYFSCNPSNIKISLIKDLFAAGLTFIKFSLDSISDEGQKQIRGKHANFTEAFEKIIEVLELKQNNNYKTTIVVTMIELSEKQREESMDFLELWKGKEVYSYIKSQDNKWYFTEEDDTEVRSHYEQQYCEYPWTSLTVMVDGTVVPCTQDYNTEMNMGNIKDNTLEEIWNSQKYRDFRAMHITGSFPPHLKCKDRCDQKIVYDYLKKSGGRK